MNIMQQIRLSHLSHGGGCGCKLAPSVLQQLLSSHPTVTPYKQLLVGLETGDDAAVWQLENGTCIIATTDFFMPMVDDPNDFGRIAATNAISDVYAMGGTPIMALAILGMPVDKIPPEMVRRVLEGGADVCGAAGIPVADGQVVRRSDAARQHVLPRPYVLKPVAEGSSVGVFIVRPGDNRPPEALRDPNYAMQRLSFISLEGFVNAKVIVEALRRAGPLLTRATFRQALESLRSFDLGIGATLTFGPERHQGLDSVYFTRVEGDHWVPIADWAAAVQV